MGVRVPCPPIDDDDENEESAFSGAAVVINIEDDVRIVTIPRVPKRLRLGEDDAYVPKIISFGPYYNKGQYGLEDMNKHKRRYLKAILSRSGCPQDDLVNKLKELEANVRSCYSETEIPNGSEEKASGEFVKMMMLDGCFIVEYLLRFHEKAKDEFNDMIWVHSLLRYDLLLLENQLPFFLLEHIFEHVKRHQQKLSRLTFLKLCIKCFKRMFNMKTIPQSPKPIHLLHLYHSFHANSAMLVQNARAADNHNRSVTETETGEEEGRVNSTVVLNADAADNDNIAVTETERGEEEGSVNSTVVLNADAADNDNIATETETGEEEGQANSTVLVLNANADNDDNTATETEMLEEEGQVDSTALVLNANADNDDNIATERETGEVEEQGHEAWEEEGSILMIPSATVLQERGISIKKNHAKGCSILDIKFSKAKGVLEIPPLFMDSSTESKFRNLIAFEQFYPRSNGRFLNDFTAYIFFMDYIVNTPEDVALLYEKGILEHCLGDDEKVADLLNNLKKGSVVDGDHYLSEVCKQVKEYQNFYLPRWRVNLMRNYFNTPWACMSVAAAAILLILTILQTVFTGISTF